MNTTAPSHEISEGFKPSAYHVDPGGVGILYHRMRQRSDGRWCAECPVCGLLTPSPKLQITKAVEAHYHSHAPKGGGQ